MSKTQANKKSRSSRSVPGNASTKAAGKRPLASAAALRSVAALHNNLLSRPADAGVTESEDAPTERQMEIYAFVRDKIHTRGYGPTVREIGTAFKIRSPNGVVCHLKRLSGRA